MGPYRAAVDHASRAFGAPSIGEITRTDIERLAASLTDAGPRARTCSLTLFVLRSIFGPALDDGLIVRNPAAKVQASGTAPKQRQALSAGDLATLRAHVAGDRLGAVWWLTLAGLRSSEILALTGADVDLSASTVTVSRWITPDASGRRGAPTGTKTRSGARCLRLAGDVVALLSTLSERSTARRSDSNTSDRDSSRSMRTARRYVPSAGRTWGRTHCQTAGVPVVTLHSARHSSVPALRAAGVSDDVGARRGMATTKRS